MRLCTTTFSIALLLGTAIGLASGQQTTNTNPPPLPAGGGTTTQHSEAPPTAPVPAAISGLHDRDAGLGRQTFHDKFREYAVATFGPRSLVSPAFPAAFQMASPPSHYPLEWRQGGKAFGRNFGDEFARAASMQTARFTVGALLHEDLRYPPSGSKNPFARTGHALFFTFFDKSDSGHTRLALANLTGAAAGGYVGNAYLPHGFNDVTHADIRTGVMFGDIAAGNLMHEFGPDIYRFCKRAHLPLPRIPLPEWWTSLKEQR